MNGPMQWTRPVFAVIVLGGTATSLAAQPARQPVTAATPAPAAPPAPRYPALPSETPAKFTPSTYGFEYARREVMVPMRDGVKLFTVVLVPRGARRAPILLTRTPYNASELTAHG